jgi:hypothetical protein
MGGRVVPAELGGLYGSRISRTGEVGTDPDPEDRLYTGGGIPNFTPPSFAIRAAMPERRDLSPSSPTGEVGSSSRVEMGEVAIGSGDGGTGTRDTTAKDQWGSCLPSSYYSQGEVVTGDIA